MVNTKIDRKKIVVGMSGGVDSSVAAYLLKKQGHEVIGVFMNNWNEDDECSATEDYEDVKRVCRSLNIPYYSVDFSVEYMDKVFQNFISEYKKGRTPNPDVLCNREIKFGPFLDYAKSLGYEYIATGHYAKVTKKEDELFLLKSFDKEKDQTYFLNQLNQDQLKHVIFPLGDISKKEVRNIAKTNNLITANKKDSTGICFIGERKFKDFLKTYIPANPGKIIDKAGNLLGSHDGLMYYTLGQRKGLKIGGIKGAIPGKRWFVIDKDMNKNQLIVSQDDDSDLYSSGAVIESVRWINDIKITAGLKCHAKFRYRQPDQKVSLTPLSSDTIRVEFDENQRAITPGQWAVFYKNNVCLGGGIIKKVIKGAYEKIDSDNR